jgi:hypothetical protein
MAQGISHAAGAESDSKVVENHKRFGNAHTRSMSGLTLSRDPGLPPAPKDQKKANTDHARVNSMTDTETGRAGQFGGQDGDRTSNDNSTKGRKAGRVR